MHNLNLLLRVLGVCFKRCSVLTLTNETVDMLEKKLFVAIVIVCRKLQLIKLNDTLEQYLIHRRPNLTQNWSNITTIHYSKINENLAKSGLNLLYENRNGLIRSNSKDDTATTRPDHIIEYCPTFSAPAVSQHPHSPPPPQAYTYTTKTNSTNSSTSVSMPHEILELIFFQLYQSDLQSCTLVSKKWNESSTPLLYRKPQINSTTSLKKFTRTLLGQKSSLHYTSHRNMVTAIYFLPMLSGSFLRSPPQEKEKKMKGQKEVVEINGTHSSLFRVLVNDSASDDNKERIPPFLPSHPIIALLLTICPNIEQIQEIPTQNRLVELNYSNPQKVKRKLMPYTWIESNYIIHQLFKSVRNLLKQTNDFFCYKNPKDIEGDVCRRVEAAFDGCVSLRETCLFILELMKEGKVGDGLTERISGVLALDAKVVLMQVQYVTLTSQRLLDSYCLLYYKALGFVNGIDTVELVKILIGLSNDVSTATTMTNETLKKNEKSLRIMDCLYTISQRDTRSPRHTSNTYIPNNELDHPALQHFWSLKLMRSVGYWDLITGEMLKSSMTGLNPGIIDDEMVEILEALTGDEAEPVDEDDNDGSEKGELEKCEEWIKEVIVYQRAQKQLEPVKGFLRDCMSNIDLLKGIQSDYNLKILD